MIPETRWARVMELFEAAVEWPPAEVERRLRDLEADAAIRAEVLGMLRADAAAEHLSAASRTAGGAPGTAAATGLPRALGAYTLVRVLGSGGFGTVYEAVRPMPDGPMRVAVKLLHAEVSTPDDLARFERERYLLASLDSPGIARFVESGQDQAGRPYLVMELVEGEPIDQYCDAKRLGVRDRVRMMAAVCRDVQAAHQRLVAHLDLKPSNILVTAEGQAKIVDFGTSKLLADSEGVTTTIRLTPHYASPEQLRHEPVSVACDTYSLGLILYELSTGAWPFGGKGSFVSTAERMLGRDAPGRLTETVTPETAAQRGTTVARLRSELAGDLEAILHKALAPSPRARYATAGALADDLEALVEGRPVSARRPTLAYRATKLVARHPVVSSAAALAVAVIGALAGYGWSQQQRALDEGWRARQTVDFLYRMLSAASPENGGRRGMTLAELVTRADTWLETDTDLPDDVRAGVQSVLSYVTFSEGEEARGLDMARRALDRARAGTDPQVHSAAIGNLVLLHVFAGRCPEAVALGAEWDQAAARLPADREARAVIVYLVGRARLVSRCENDPARAAALAGRAVEMLLRASERDVSRIDRASTLVAHAGHLADAGQPAEARAAIDEGLRLVENHPDGDTVRLSLLRLLANLAATAGDFRTAARALEEAVRIAPGRSTPFAEVRLKASWAARLAQSGERERALALARDVRDEAERRMAEFAASRWMILIDVADAMMEAGDCSEVPGLLASADGLAGAGMPTAWRVVRLKVDALCRAQAGDAAGAQARAAEALDVGATLLAAAPITERRLRALVGPAH
ncbi:MAG: serine/threonine protein kinase [Acidobacteria bacterium]|nr:serine/threonine protein kinase [Acidobacteriota bacterium]